MSYGYSRRLIDANTEADESSCGVQLGRWCIQHDIPVVQIAGVLGVSRMTVYNWFCGATNPTREYCVKIERLMGKQRKTLSSSVK